jgi:hypothetical protein
MDSGEKTRLLFACSSARRRARPAESAARPWLEDSFIIELLGGPARKAMAGFVIFGEEISFFFLP